MVSTFDAVTLTVAAIAHSAGLYCGQAPAQRYGHFFTRLLIWGGMTSYDMRNSALAVVLVRRHGHRNWDSPASIRRVWKPWPSILQQLAVVAAVCRDAVVVSFSPSLAASALSADFAAGEAGDLPFNKNFYELFAPGKVHHYLTNYHIALYPPETKKH